MSRGCCFDLERGHVRLHVFAALDCRLSNIPNLAAERNSQRIELKWEDVGDPKHNFTMEWL